MATKDGAEFFRGLIILMAIGFFIYMFILATKKNKFTNVEYFDENIYDENNYDENNNLEYYQ